MINNLLTSILIAGAVGTTALSNNQPNKTINIETDAYIDSNLSENGDTIANLTITASGITPQRNNTGTYTTAVYTQQLTNNSLMTITSSQYILNKISQNITDYSNKVIGYIYTAVQVNYYASYDVNQQQIMTSTNVAGQIEGITDAFITDDISYCVIDTSTTTAYNNMIARTLATDTDISNLDANFTYALSNNNASSETLNSGAIDETGFYVNLNSLALNVNSYNQSLIIVKETITAKKPSTSNAFSVRNTLVQANDIQITSVLHPNGTVVSPEPVNIPGMLYTVLTLPFSFMTQAFNLTVFPGTAYALNFGDLILAVVGALILIFIIRTIVGFIK